MLPPSITVSVAPVDDPIVLEAGTFTTMGISVDAIEVIGTLVLVSDVDADPISLIDLDLVSLDGDISVTDSNAIVTPIVNGVRISGPFATVQGALATVQVSSLSLFSGEVTVSVSVNEGDAVLSVAIPVSLVLINVLDNASVAENFEGPVGSVISVSGLGPATDSAVDVMLTAGGGVTLSQGGSAFSDDVNVVCSASSCNSILGGLFLRTVPDSEEPFTLLVDIVATDGGSTVANQSFVVAYTIDAINTAPFVLISGVVTIDEDVADVIGSGVVDFEDVDAGLDEIFTVTIDSSVLLVLDIDETSTNVFVQEVSARSLELRGTLTEVHFAVALVSVIPVENESGSGVVTISIRDGFGDSSSGADTIAVTILPVNDAPTVVVTGLVPAGLEGQDIGLGRLVEVTDLDSDLLLLSATPSVGILGASTSASVASLGAGVQIVSDEVTLSDVAFVLLLGGTGANGDIVITIEVSDGVATTVAEAVVSVEPLNSAPILTASISDMSFATVEEERVFFPLNFLTMFDEEEGRPEAGTYTLTLETTAGILELGGLSGSELVVQGTLQAVRDVIGTQRLVLVAPDNFGGFIDISARLDDGSMIPVGSAMNDTVTFANVSVTEVIDSVDVVVGDVEVVAEANNTIRLAVGSIDISDSEGDDVISIRVEVEMAVIVSFDNDTIPVLVEFFPDTVLIVTGLADDVSAFIGTIVLSGVEDNVGVSVAVVDEGEVESDVPLDAVSVTVSVPSLFVSAAPVVLGDEDFPVSISGAVIFGTIQDIVSLTIALAPDESNAVLEASAAAIANVGAGITLISETNVTVFAVDLNVLQDIVPLVRIVPEPDVFGNVSVFFSVQSASGIGGGDANSTYVFAEIPDPPVISTSRNFVVADDTTGEASFGTGLFTIQDPDTDELFVTVTAFAGELRQVQTSVADLNQSVPSEIEYAGSVASCSCRSRVL